MAAAKEKLKVPAWVESAIPKKDTQTTDDPKQTLKANLQMLASDYGDPEQQKKKIFEMLGPNYLKHLRPQLNRVLLITHVWPDRRQIRNEAGKVMGTLILPEQQINANRFEGKTGLVIALGETAFKYFDRDGNPILGRLSPSIGDWVWYNASDAMERGYGMTTANMLWGRTIYDSDVEGIATDPRTVF